MKHYKVLFAFLIFGVSAFVFADVLHEASVSITSAETSQFVKIEVNESSESAELVGDEKIIQEVTLLNDGLDAWVRIKRVFVRGNTEEARVCFLDGAPLEFVEGSDGYLYFTEPILHNESVSWEELIEIPDSERDESNQDLCSHLLAEAVQKSCFYPQFDSESPWGETQPEYVCLYRSEDETHK